MASSRQMVYPGPDSVLRWILTTPFRQKADFLHTGCEPVGNPLPYATFLDLAISTSEFLHQCSSFQKGSLHGTGNSFT